MAVQVRLYTIQAGRMEEWLAGWMTSVYPLRLRKGFRIPAAWVIRERNQFLWILERDGDFEAANRAYYESPERKALNPDPAPLIESQETWFAERVV